MFARNILAQKVCPTTEIRVLELNGCIFDSGRPPRSIFSGRPRTDRPSKSFFLSKNKENCLILEPFFFVYLGSQMKLLLFGIPNKIAFVWDPKQNCFCLGLQIKSRFSHTAPRSPSILKVFCRILCCLRWSLNNFTPRRIFFAAKKVVQWAKSENLSSKTLICAPRTPLSATLSGNFSLSKNFSL